MATPPDVFKINEAGIDPATLTLYAGARACGNAILTCKY